MIFGDLEGLKLPEIYFTSEEKHRKTSPRKLFPTGDRTRARCVTGAPATACFTAVDINNNNNNNNNIIIIIITIIAITIIIIINQIFICQAKVHNGPRPSRQLLTSCPR